MTKPILLKELILESIEEMVSEDKSLDDIVDYLLSEEDEGLEEAVDGPAKVAQEKDRPRMAPYKSGPAKVGQEKDRPRIAAKSNPIDEIQGRTSGGARKYTLNSKHSVEEVTSFLKKIQSLISKSKKQGRKPNNFTDEDIETFASILTQPEGFDRKEILSQISFYEGKPFQAAQKMMDIMGEPKMTGKLDIKGEPIEIGKGYIKVLDKVKDDEKSDAPSTKRELEIEDLEDIEDLDFGDTSLNENSTKRMLQKRAGLLND